MEPGEWARKALDIIESETRDLVYSGAPTPTSEPEVEIAPLVQKVGAISIAEIENMIGELQAAKDFLESEGERVQREAEHYTTLTQMAPGGPPRTRPFEISPIRSHARPSRGQYQFVALAGSALAAVPATDSNRDP